MSKPLSLQNAQFGLVPPERLGALVSAFLSAAPLLTRSNIHRRDSLPAVSCNAGFCNAPEARCLTSTMLMALQKPHRYANAMPPVTQTGPCSQLPLAVILAPRARPHHNGFVVRCVAAGGACATGVVSAFWVQASNNSVTGPGYQVFLSELRKLGFTEGQNLVVEYRRIGGARDYVYHSTGKRVRDLPITMEKLL